MGALPHLLLFDIDGTLLNTGGVGMRAFASTFEQLYPEQVADQGGVLGAQVRPLDPLCPLCRGRKRRGHNRYRYRYCYLDLYQYRYRYQ